MKRNLILLNYTCIVLIFNPCYSQLTSINGLGDYYTYEYDKFYWGLSFTLNGNIKSIDQKKYKLISKSGKLIRGRHIKSDDSSNLSLKFDEYGNIVESNEFNYPFKVKSTHNIHSYNNLGNIIETKVYNPNKKLLETYRFNYDENNKLTEIKGFNANRELINIKTYKYDTIGHIIEKEWIVDSNTYKKYVYSYDENDNLIKILYTNLNYSDLYDAIFQIIFEAAVCYSLNIGYPDPYDPLDPAYGSVNNETKDIHLRIEKKYDDHNNLIEESIYDTEYQNHPGTLIEKYNAEYDTNGNILKELRVHGKTSIELSHKYDEKGYKIETNLIHIAFGEIKTEIKSTIINDKDGKVVEIIEILKSSINNNEMNRIKFTEKFEYDANDNFSKIYFFKRDKPKYVIERKIEYY